MREVYRARDTKLNLDVAIRGLTIVDINGLPQLTESSVCDPPAPTIWEGARLDRAPDWSLLSPWRTRSSKLLTGGSETRT